MTTDNGSDLTSLDLQPSSLERADIFRRRKRTTLLAIVFTDIADSTALRETLGEVRYEQERERFDAEFEQIVCRDDGGCIVKGTGDGALIVFDEPSVAVQRALEVQDALGTHFHFRLRVGIDLGQVSIKSSFGLKSDIFGRHVNRAARIQSLAEPGHVLTSFSVYDCAVGWLDSSAVAWHNHNSHPLKGIDEEISIHECFDPRIGRPQEVRRAVVTDYMRTPMFSRGPLRLPHYLPVATDEWHRKKLAARAEFQPSNADAGSYADENLLEDFVLRIMSEVDALKKGAPEPLSVGWFDAQPKRNKELIDLFRKSGMIVDVNPPNTGREGYLFIVGAVSTVRGHEPVLAGLMPSSPEAGGPLRIIYGLNSTLARLQDEIAVLGVSLATSGMVTLLRTVERYLATLRRSMPVEYEAEPDPRPRMIRGQVNRRSWSQRIRRLLKPSDK